MPAKMPQSLGIGVMATMSSFKSLSNPNLTSARSGGGHRVPSPRMQQDANRHYGFIQSSGKKTHESNQSMGTYGVEEPYFKGTARF